MSILKANFIFFSLMAIITLSVVMTSCEQEELLPTNPTINKKATPTEALEVAPNEEQLYIVSFKTTNEDKRKAFFEQTKSQSREQKRVAAENISKDLKGELKAVTKRLNIEEERVSDYYEFVDAALINLTPEQAKALKKNPLVSNIEADKYVEPNLPEPQEVRGEAPPQTETKSDYYGWFNYNHGGYQLGGATKSTWIWIIDTGIDLDHPDLNVQTDTYYAKSFVGGTANDCNGHGTHVAGIAAARKNNIGMVGMSEGAKVVPVRIMGCTGGFPQSRLVDAVNHIIPRAIAGDVLNMSVGGRGTMLFALKVALNNLSYQEQVYIATSAGNDALHASGQWPATYSTVYMKTVASMDYNSVFSSFSNYGIAPVDYIATGRNVYSTYRYGGYATLSGTSMASPVVAGIMHARGGFPATSGTVYSRGQNYPKVRL